MRVKCRDSVRTKITVSVTVALLVFFIGFGALLFSRWFSTTQELIRLKAGKMSEKINQQISAFIEIPLLVNESSEKLHQQGILDFQAVATNELYLVEALSYYGPPVYSLSYSKEEDGSYYASHYTPTGEIEFIQNSALMEGQAQPKLNEFDPRETVWYQLVKQKGTSTFSSVYKNPRHDDLTISLATPMYNQEGRLQGVFATHFLLSDLNSFLVESVQDFGGIALIIETESGNIIANSLEQSNYKIGIQGELQRVHISEMDLDYVEAIYHDYHQNQESQFVYKVKGETYNLVISNLKEEGIAWCVISIIPEGPLFAPLKHDRTLVVLFSSLFVVLLVLMLNLRLRTLLQPVNTLLATIAALTRGDLSQRTQLNRKDEFGLIAHSFDSLADTLAETVQNLEAKVLERTQQLHSANQDLAENANQLRQILDSVAEGVYGLDRQGICIFCNQGALEILGYQNVEELIDQEMHTLIHYADEQKNPLASSECSVFKAMEENRGLYVDHEVFWRSDGTSFDVAYYTHPLVHNHSVTGAVVTFTDITERKQRERLSQYLSSHDSLTGLLNRHSVEELSARLDKITQLPISILFADLNGLKLTNDIFGHVAGDQLIKRASVALKQFQRAHDLVGRVGGDEFVMFLPKTSKEEAIEIATQISTFFAQEDQMPIRCNMSIGVETKDDASQVLEAVKMAAENEMYRHKTANRKRLSRSTIDTIMGNIFERSDQERRHASNVRSLCERLGQRLALTPREISTLSRAAYLHDIGKITLDNQLLNQEQFNAEELLAVQQHVVTGFRILNLFDQTLDLAEYVYSHHEHWDGSGFPRGISGEQIPLLSRLIAIAESYDRALYRERNNHTNAQEKACQVIIEGSGSRFDPYLAQVLIEFVQCEDL